MFDILNQVNSPNDLKRLNIQQLTVVCEEIRNFLVEHVSKTGGHLASNLGIVELTVALHYVFNSPIDRIIWDVGHQSYIHKILTGRKDKFDSLRQLGGISGFPKRCESMHDAFDTGHSSTSISASLGIAKARDLMGENYSVISVIGDGALTGGMAYEALNHAGHSKTNLIVILNDNEMAISQNVGGISSYLNRVRTEPFYFRIKEDIDFLLNKIPTSLGKNASKAIDKAKGSIKYLLMPGVVFEEMGFKYIGPLNGHNVDELIKMFKKVKHFKGPVLLHVITKKGKGYKYAENNPGLFHGIPPFDIETGKPVQSKHDYSNTFGKHLVELAEKDYRIVAVTAAMPDGTGLKNFSEKFPKRFFDVGIAEQHAATFCAGLALSGLKPVLAIYSTFLQRAYDQILHDIALQNANVVFAIDRSGIVGNDGETHQGIYDISYLTHIPNMTLLAPSDYSELRQMLSFSIYEMNSPVAIRYPRGSGEEQLFCHDKLVFGKAEVAVGGSDVTIIAAGSMLRTAIAAARQLEKSGISCEVINPRFIKPLDEQLIVASAQKTGRILTIEENALNGGMGASVMQIVNSNFKKVPIKSLGFPDKFIQHGNRDELLKLYGLDCESLMKQIADFVNNNKV